MSLYGYCPQCGERGVRRERRLGGNDTCEAGHTYPTAQSHSQPDALIARLTRENSDHAAELARVEAANALLRAECEAWREVDAACKRDFDDDYDGPSGIDEAGEMLTKARAATDAAGILKGVE